MTTSTDPSPASPTETIVVGGGLAGLTAAATLARAGRAVTLLERSGSELGGRAGTTEHGGFALNEGPHALYTSGRAMPILRNLGLDPSGVAPPLDGGGAWCNGAIEALPTSPKALLTTKILSGRSKLTAAGILPRLQRGADRAAAGLTLTEWFDRRRVPIDLRRMIEMYTRLSTYTNAPDQLAAAAALSQIKLALDGVLYLHDGWRQLVVGLRSAVEKAGGTIMLDGQVTALQRSSGIWGVELAGGAVRHADNVVLCVGGPQVSSKLAGADPGWTERAGPAAVIASLDLGLRHAPSMPILLSVDDPLYASTHAPAARLAPPGHALVGVVRYLAPDETVDRTDLRCSLDEHARRMGIDVDAAVYDRYLHRMTAAHGTVLADRERPRGDELAAQRLWCAGDWVGSDLSLLADAAVGSGADAANAILTLS